mgnify:CR=1 FL=1
MNIIAAVTKNWGIGKDGRLLLSLPEDRKFFRETTLDSAVLMGRATLDSFPGGKPLPRRTNIVLSRDLAFHPDGVTVVRSTEDALREVKRFDSNKVFVIGGEIVYETFLPYCRYAYITKMDVQPEADRFLTDLDSRPGWFLETGGEWLLSGGVRYRFVRYENRDPLPF